MRISSGSPCCAIDLRSTIAPTQRTEARPNVVDPLDQIGIAGAKGPSRTQRLDRAQSPYGVGRTEPADPEHRERSILARGTRQRIGRRRRRTRRPREPHRALDPNDPIARLPRPGPHRRGTRGYSSSRLWRHPAHGSSGALCRSMARVGSDTPHLIRSPSFT